MGLIDIISGLFNAGKTIENIAGSIERAYEKRLAAQTDSEKLEADKQIAFFQAQMQLAVAAQSDKWWSPRSLVNFGWAFIVLKFLIWDTALGLGTTPYPGSLVTGIILTITGFNFGSKAVGDTGAKLIGMISRR